MPPPDPPPAPPTAKDPAIVNPVPPLPPAIPNTDASRVPTGPNVCLFVAPPASLAPAVPLFPVNNAPNVVSPPAVAGVGPAATPPDPPPPIVIVCETPIVAALKTPLSN